MITGRLTAQERIRFVRFILCPLSKIDFALDTSDPIWYLNAHAKRDKTASSPSGKAELCKSSITSSNLVEASITSKSQPLSAGFFVGFTPRVLFA